MPWVAFWGGWCVRRIGPGGEHLGEIRLPVAQVSSCAFGGPRLDRLFVTTASVGLDAEARAAQPLAGGLFELDVGVAGLPSSTFAG
jgi:xylono-1,5-lactonase